MKYFICLTLAVTLVVPAMGSAANASPIMLDSSVKLISTERIADLSDRPWKKELPGETEAEGAEQYVWTYFPTDAERASDEKAISNYFDGTEITHNSYEWFQTPTNGTYPMTSFLLASGLGVQTHLHGRYTAKVDPEEEQDQLLFQHLTAPYVSTSTQNLVTEWVRYQDASKWGFGFWTSGENGMRTTYKKFILSSTTTEPEYHANFLTILPNGDWAFRYQDPGRGDQNPNCENHDAVWWDACRGPWFIKTNHGVYGPYTNVSPPIPTIDNHLYFWDKKGEKEYVLYLDGVSVSTWEYIDNVYYRNQASQLVYRARKGNEWFVVTNNIASQAWDYVDQLLINTKTGSVMYRARDIHGKWYMVKNGQAKRVPFEPDALYLDEKHDAPIALRTARTTGKAPGALLSGERLRIFTFAGTSYVLSGSLRLDKIASDGKLLFVRAADGKSLQFWINNRYIGRATYFDSVTLTGPVNWFFDEKNNLVFYTFDHGVLSRWTYLVR